MTPFSKSSASRGTARSSRGAGGRRAEEEAEEEGANARAVVED